MPVDTVAMAEDFIPRLRLDAQHDAAARALERLGAAVLALDEGGRVVSATSAARDVLGWSVGDVALAPRLDEVLEGASGLWRALRKGRDVTDGEVVAPSGGRRIELEALRDEEGALLGGVAILGAPHGERAGRRAPAGNHLGGLIGQAPVMREVFDRLARAAASDVTVLLTGESGTGKEVAARALHELGERRDGPFQAVHCAALAPSLLESELFGHVAGAFTGAAGERVGLIEAANGGTLFLDEIGELSLELQVKLLRVLESREVTRVGASDSRAVDVRVVSATNRDLRRRVDSGEMREDFFYRIAVFEVRMPSMRERPEDLPLLTRHVVAELLTSLERDPVRIPPETMDVLLQHRWPGNVRELRNVLESALVSCDGEVLLPEHLPDVVRGPQSASGGWSPREEEERRRIRTALDEHDWNRTRTAEALGVSRVTLWKKMRRFALDEETFRRG